MKKISSDTNYCDVSASSKDSRRHQIRRVYCEEVLGDQYTLVLVPKHRDPDILGVCSIYNISCKMDENQLTMKPVIYQETENHCVRVLVPDLTSFITGLLNTFALTKGDDKKIFSLCERVKKDTLFESLKHESEENTDDEHQAFIPKWASK